MKYKYSGNKEDIKILVRFLLKNDAYEEFNALFDILFHDSVIRDVHSIFDRIEKTYGNLRLLNSGRVVSDSYHNIKELYESFKRKIRLDYKEWYKFFFGYNKERFEKEWVEWVDELHKVRPDKVSIILVDGHPCLKILLYDNMIPGGIVSTWNDISKDEVPQYLRKHLTITSFEEGDSGKSKFLILKHQYIF